VPDVESVDEIFRGRIGLAKGGGPVDKIRCLLSLSKMVIAIATVLLPTHSSIVATTTTAAIA